MELATIVTVKHLYEALLLELDKVEAPAIYLDGFNYYANKAVQEYVNYRYNFAENRQQLTDDLRALYKKINVQSNPVILPNDYYHLLACQVEFKASKPYKCYAKDSIIKKSAKRFTSDMISATLDNAYQKPSFERPRYFIETNNLHILHGDDDRFTLHQVSVEYYKTPQTIRLLEEHLGDEDTSQVLEFSAYVNAEILKFLVKLLLEKDSNPRLQTNIPINQTIKN